MLQPHPLPGRAEASQDESGKTQDALEATLLMEKHQNQPFWIRMAWILPSQTPTSVTSWRNTS